MVWAAGGTRRRAPRRPLERGSQAVEFALLLPAVALVAVAVGLAGLLAADVVAAQTLARDAARHAAAGDPAAARDVVETGAPGAYELVLDPPDPRPGEAVTATVRLRPRVAPGDGDGLWLPEAAATMRAEAP